MCAHLPSTSFETHRTDAHNAWSPLHIIPVIFARDGLFLGALRGGLFLPNRAKVSGFREGQRAVNVGYISHDSFQIIWHSTLDSTMWLLFVKSLRKIVVGLSGLYYTSELLEIFTYYWVSSIPCLLAKVETIQWGKNKAVAWAWGLQRQFFPLNKLFCNKSSGVLWDYKRSYFSLSFGQ